MFRVILMNSSGQNEGWLVKIEIIGENGNLQIETRGFSGVLGYLFQVWGYFEII